MAYDITLVVAQADEQIPDIALYALDASGRITAKYAVVAGSQLQPDLRRLNVVVAFGLDVKDLASALVSILGFVVFLTALALTAILRGT
jgi:hypothetical protein